MTSARDRSSSRDTVAAMRRRQQPMSSCCGDPIVGGADVSPRARRVVRLALAAVVVVALAIVLWLAL